MNSPAVLPILHPLPEAPAGEAPLVNKPFVSLSNPWFQIESRRASDPAFRPSFTRKTETKKVTIDESAKPTINNSWVNKHKKAIPRPQTPALEIDAPPPEIYVDTENGKYGIRCICGIQTNEGFMIQCEKCGFWVHGLCVNVSRLSACDHFFCPFCKKKPIRCSCEDNKRYDENLIQCFKCKYWVHKTCAGLGYGRDPPRFICQTCGGFDSVIPFCAFDPNSKIHNFKTFLTCNLTTLVQQIPDGAFRNFILADLNKGELHFHEMIARYFNAFCEQIFNEDPEFWQCFTDTMMKLLGCEKKVLFSAIDHLANQLIYDIPKPGPEPLFVALGKFEISEKAQLYIQLDAIPKYEKPITHPQLVKRDNGVFIQSDVEENGFICDISGVLYHYFEMPASKGLKLEWISIPNTEFVIDTEKTSFTYCKTIKRSFHYNCQPKLIRINNDVHIALFAHRMKGPLADHQSKKLPAIRANEEIILPLDGDLPYKVPKTEWKEKKHKVHHPVIPHPSIHVTTRSMEKKKEEIQNATSLLSLFYDSAVPILPFQVMTEKEVEEKEKIDAIMKSTTRILTRNSLKKDESKPP